MKTFTCLLLLAGVARTALAQGPITITVVYDNHAPHPELTRREGNRQVKVITNTRTPGLAGARNSGILHADTELVAFCDDDDAWKPSKLTRQVALMRQENASGCVSGIEISYGQKRMVRIPQLATVDTSAITQDRLTGYDPTFKVNPPLRPTEDAEALREALADGTIDIVATDHAPHARQDKEHAFVDAAFGMLGLETALGVVSTVMVDEGRMSWADVARVMSTAPARIARLTTQGQGITPGAPANLTLVDPTRKVTVDRSLSKSLSRNNPWHGLELTGAPHMTILRGRVTAREGLVWGEER